MSEKKIFPDGVYFNLPHEKAPDFVIGKLSIQKDRFMKWLETQEVTEKGYIKFDVKTAREEGKANVELDTWKADPDTATQPTAPTPTAVEPNTTTDEVDPDDIPF